MADYFFDSSALVKRYVTEIGTSWVTRLLLPTSGHRIHVASITTVEVTAALARRERGQQLSTNDFDTAMRQFRSDLHSIYETVDVTERLIAQAMVIAETHALRGYDAVQLASALAINTELLTAGLPAITLVSADLELNLTAQAESLLVENPNNHP